MRILEFIVYQIVIAGLSLLSFSFILYVHVHSYSKYDFKLKICAHLCSVRIWIQFEHISANLDSNCTQIWVRTETWSANMGSNWTWSANLNFWTEPRSANPVSNWIQICKSKLLNPNLQICIWTKSKSRLLNSGLQIWVRTKPKIRFQVWIE